MSDENVLPAIEQARFDALLEEAIAALPASLQEVIERVPLIVVDYPERDVRDEFADEAGQPAAADDLCGLHAGMSITERDLNGTGELPNYIMLYRAGIIAAAGGWVPLSPENSAGQNQDDAEGQGGEDAVYDQIMITLLHELGHEMGLSEEDLKNLGFD